jgi:hypothetical protein
MTQPGSKFLKLFCLIIVIFFTRDISAENEREVKEKSKNKSIVAINSAEQINTNDSVLAIIGNKKITAEDFLNRSNLTVRPARFKNKNTTLNNLISEKILALEAEKNNTSLLLDPMFLGRLKGIKEQHMREKLYEVKAAAKVVLDSNEVDQKYKTSKREYETEFFVIGDDSVSKSIGETIKRVPGSADSIFTSLETKISKKPIQEVKYLDVNDYNITEALFSSLLDKGAVVGPIKLHNGDNIIMRINNWKDEILFSGEDQRIRWNKVAEKIKQENALDLWDQYMLDIMKGKRIDYNEPVFFKLANLAYQYHVNKNLPDSVELRLNEIPKLDEALDPKSTFFTIDGKVWTVDDFKHELVSHPLVYRAKFNDQKSFNHQFLQAIADMMRDHYLNKEAYSLSLDTDQGINNTINIWKDSFLAIDQEKNILDFAIQKGLIRDEDNIGKLNYWESYLTGLQKRYSYSIKINYKLFKKIKLNKIDFIALKPGDPFPVLFPGFPILISSDNLKYVKEEIRSK